MRGLFVRIFLSFWAAMTLIGIAFGAIYVRSAPSAGEQRYQDLAQRGLRSEATLARAAFDRGDVDEARTLLVDYQRSVGVRATLLRDGAPIVSSTPPSREMVALGLGVRDSAVRRTLGALHLFAVRIDEHTVAVGEMKPRSRFIRFLAPDTLAPRLLVVFLVSGLVSFALASRLTRPLRTVRSAAQRLAEGDLTVRITPSLENASEEVAQLARDFDRMATQLGALLGAQKQLLRDVSHELRSPLSRLNVALELARQKAGPDASAPLDRIETESNRLAHLVGQILAMNSLEHRVVEASSHVDVVKVLEEVVEGAHYEASARGSRVTLRATGPLALPGDPEALRWAFENVIRNAVRFTEPGTEVSVDATRDEAHMRIEVRDHGGGVPEADLERIFLPFHRASEARDRKSGGVGLGLAIAERAVEIHGGTLSASNADGGGLRVTIELPVPEAEG